MVVLDAVVEDPESRTRGSGQSGTDGRERACVAKRWKFRPRAERDMDRAAGIVALTAAVGNRTPACSRRTARAVAASAPRSKGKVALVTATHLNVADIISNKLACQVPAS